MHHISDSTSLWDALEEARKRYESGEPHLSRGLVLSLLLINKLEKERMWGGNAKGYKWAGDMPSGRGMPEEYSGLVPNLINLLLSHNLLIKKVSQGKNKYALNPNFRPQIYDALRTRNLEGFPLLWRILERDSETLSSRLLDAIRT